MREAIELREATNLYYAQPLEDNLFEWHFTIGGPPGSDYEGGRYHGRIILPPEYPMKPPSIVLLTPNGRFELNQKICLNASSYHPELWQASWGIRTMLLALIGFMPTSGLGTIGSLECSPEERRRLAKRSLNWVCPSCGSANLNSLPEGDTTGKEEEVKKEMKDIISQMAITSEAEVNERFKQQQKKAENISKRVEQNETPREQQISSPNLPQTSSSSVTVETELRQRVPNALSQSEEIGNIETQQPGSQSSNMTLIIIVILMLCISLLLLRRLFLM